MLKKVVIIGPESTGKSTLCEQLAAHFHTQWVPEYARAYLVEHGTSYNYEDLLAIAQGQIQAEDRYTTLLDKMPQTATLLFIDTDMYVMKVWSEFVFGKCHSWILEQIAHRVYDLYLLCNTDLPWVKDELREYPDFATRDQLFRIYKDLMVQQATPWVEIRGADYEERFRQAVAAVAQHTGIAHSQ